MTARECHHDTTTHDYTTTLAGDTVRIDRVCDRCAETLDSVTASAEEDA